MIEPSKPQEAQGPRRPSNQEEQVRALVYDACSKVKGVPIEGITPEGTPTIIRDGFVDEATQAIVALVEQAHKDGWAAGWESRPVDAPRVYMDDRIEQAETAARIDELEQLWRTYIIPFNKDEMVPLAEVEKLFTRVNKRLAELKGAGDE